MTKNRELFLNNFIGFLKNIGFFLFLPAVSSR